jgi:hypothetical protein
MIKSEVIPTIPIIKNVIIQRHGHSHREQQQCIFLIHSQMREHRTHREKLNRVFLAHELLLVEIAIIGTLIQTDFNGGNST